LLLSTGLTANVSAQSQVLGPWKVSAPDSASLIIGGGVRWVSLSVVNTPLSVNDAFSGLPLDDDGFANADVGTTVEVNFLSGVVNRPGDDVVMFEARFDEGDYAISSDHDGFVASTTVSTAGLTTLVDHYYYVNGGGPSPASVIGVAVNLSSIGVPPGAMVHSLRFTSANLKCDPIGLGRIVPGPVLVVPQYLLAGRQETMEVTSATPFSTVGFMLSKAGPGPQRVTIGTCGVLTLSLSLPISPIALKTTDAAGTASFTGVMPASISGRFLFLQAMDLAACEPTNMVERSVF